MLANVTTHSPEVLSGSALIALPFGICNTAGAFRLLTIWHASPLPTNSKFVGMADYTLESSHDLHAEESKSSISREGSHHPLWECFVGGTLEGHVETLDG